MPDVRTQKELEELGKRMLATNNEFKEKTLPAYERLVGKEAAKKQEEKFDKMEVDPENIESMQNLADEAENMNAEVKRLTQEAFDTLLKNGRKEVRSYIRKRVGNTAAFEELLYDQFASEDYKGENDYLPADSLKKVFGTKGALNALYVIKKNDSEEGATSFRMTWRGIYTMYKSLGKHPAPGAKASVDYIRKYNHFIDYSSTRAFMYLKKKFESKFKKLQKFDQDNYTFSGGEEPGDYAVSVCKLAFMCLVAAGSKDQARSKKAVNMYKKIKRIYKNIIG